jgi:deoxyadenosine/deoxycytidine kinase
VLKYIAVAGNMGAGKTSLVEYLQRQFDLIPFYEPNDENPYLADFYRDMGRWSFHSQTYFLSKKARLHQQLQASTGTAIQDRTIYEDAEIFATYLYRSRRMAPRDYHTYMELYGAMKENLPPPDVLVYLKCSVRAIRTRIKVRGRDYEQDIKASYLRKLNQLYEKWIDGWDDSPVVVWDTEEGDYLTDLVHQIEFNQAIEQYL